MTECNRLPWKIEAYREYISYETLQPAAAVLNLFEGELFSIKNPNIVRMQKLLEKRTNKYSWLPNRSGNENINWNIEGDVTRNKGRVFTSMLILYPKEWVGNKVVLTKFGKALAEGKINKASFYNFIISRFKYPHPAWGDDADVWNKSGKVLYPFIYILQSLVELYKVAPSEAYVSTEEVADYLHSSSDHKQLKKSIKNLIKSRELNTPPIKRNKKEKDEINRKINDVLGFLCMSDYCFYKGNFVYLNLISCHHKERVHYMEKRKDENKLTNITSLIDNTLNRQ